MKTNSYNTFLSLLSLTVLLAGSRVSAEINRVTEVTTDVYFHEGDLDGHGHCNNGWIIFEDYVLVIDANFPSGAESVIPKIRKISDKPIRFVFDTHHHGDHAYGNQVWVDAGATPVAHENVIDELKKYETGYYGGEPGRWEEAAKSRPDVAGSQLKPPSLLFQKTLVFDDGVHRVELYHFGTAHTHGDGFAWLPKEKILFTGDACVNGPYNYMGDGHSGEWIKTLEAAKQLGAETILPGHGPVAGPELLSHQQAYFRALRSSVKRLINEGKDLDGVLRSAAVVKAAVMENNSISKYIGKSFEAQLEKVYSELAE